MTSEKFAELKSYQKALEDDRVLYEDVFKDIANYVMPHRYNWEEDESLDTERPVIYDGTAVEANRMLADGYQGYLINPRAPWINLRFELAEIDKTSEAEQWKRIATDQLYRIFARSNLYSAIGMTLLDGAFGTATLYSEKYKPTVMNYIPQHPKGIFISQNRHGIIDTLFHRMRLYARDIMTAYPDAIPESKKKDFRDAPFKKHTVWRAVLPNDDMILDAYGPKGMRYSSTTYMVDMEEPLNESGYKRFPYDIWRPMICTGESYGKSPAWHALGDIKRLNIVQKDLLELASLTVKTPLNVPGEMMGNVNMTPWGMNPYTDPSRLIFPMAIGGNFPYGAEEVQMLQRQVQSYFQVEAFQLLTMMADKEYTATQAAEMAGEKSAQLTSLTSRVTLFLDGIVQNALFSGIEMGVIPKPSDKLKQSALKFDYIGPLTVDQERAFRTTGLLRGLNMIAPYLEINPGIWDLIKDTEVFREILEGSGMPKSFMRTQGELKAINEQKAQQQQAAQQAELAKTNAQAYMNSTYKPEDGSAAQEMMKNGGR